MQRSAWRIWEVVMTYDQLVDLLRGIPDPAAVIAMAEKE